MKYDAVIVGASVAGLYCGLTLAKNGWRVFACDRRSTIGIPVRCGEAAGNRMELKRFVDVDESFIARDINGLAVHCNGIHTFSRNLPNACVVLHRDKFEQHLAEKAAAAGMEIHLKSRAVSLIKNSYAYSGICLEDGTHIEADIIIGADGAESSVGQWAGIVKPLHCSEAFTAIQYTLESDFCNDEFLHFFLGSQIIPKGYIWIFPKADNVISAGAGIYGCNHRLDKASDYLSQFLDTHVPGCERKNLITGSAPVTLCPKSISIRNIAIIGDAARQCNPLTAGGIMNALEAADSAAKKLIASRSSSERRHALISYASNWSKRSRREQKLFLIAKEAFIGMTDMQIMEIITGLLALFNKSAIRSYPFRFPYFKAALVFIRFLSHFCRHLHILWR